VKEVPPGFNIAIDGPAGSGKSTVARKLAQKLGLLYVDTGAMYRAVTYLVLKSGIDPADESAVTAFTQGLRFSLVRFLPKGVVDLWCNGEEVTPYLREPEVSRRVAEIAALRGVREHLVRCQRLFARKGGVVMEGRDIGTVVLPDSEYKFFLTADPDVRLARREKELLADGRHFTKEELRREMNYRDEMDLKREIAPLKPAPDAVVIDCTSLTVEEVVAKMLRICRGV
jgi:cytidylate kinase